MEVETMNALESEINKGSFSGMETVDGEKAMDLDQDQVMVDRDI